MVNNLEREKFLKNRLQKSITVCLTSDLELKGKLIAYDDVCIIVEIPNNPNYSISYKGKTIMIKKGSFSMIF